MTLLFCFESERDKEVMPDTFIGVDVIGQEPVEKRLNTFEQAYQFIDGLDVGT